jgi:molecular chaperone GrpE
VTGATVKNDSQNPGQPENPADESKAESGPPASTSPEASANGAGAGAPTDAPEGPEAEIKALRERLLRTAADFDNYRKRSRKDIQDAERRVQENLLQVLVQPFDNLERAAQHAETAQDVKALAEGLKMVLRQFEDALSSVGIQRIVSVGKPFDPSEHEAVQHIQTDDVPPGAVAQELRAGYRWQDRLIRPALVVVAKAPAAAADGQP